MSRPQNINNVCIVINISFLFFVLFCSTLLSSASQFRVLYQFAVIHLKGFVEKVVSFRFQLLVAPVEPNSRLGIFDRVVGDGLNL